MPIKFTIRALLSALCTAVVAQSNTPLAQGASVRTITPIFSQLLSLALPTGFMPAFEDAKGNQYIHESVLQGESLKSWSQMLTITGAKGLAANPNITPNQFASGMAGGYKKSCPDSFTATGLGVNKLGGYDGFVAVISCGVAEPVGTPYSESTLLIVIKGENDYYTIQWAERGAASKTPIKYDPAKWVDRFNKLAPINLCPRIPSEQAPYPSCANRK